MVVPKVFQEKEEEQVVRRHHVTLLIEGVSICGRGAAIAETKVWPGIYEKACAIFAFEPTYAGIATRKAGRRIIPPAVRSRNSCTRVDSIRSGMSGRSRFVHLS